MAVVGRGALLLLCFASGPAAAAAPFSCAGVVQAGAAELFCSHTDPAAAAQICTYSWTLAPANGGASVVQGSFMLVSRQENAAVYQGAGFNAALGTPVVMCRGLARPG